MLFQNIKVHLETEKEDSLNSTPFPRQQMVIVRVEKTSFEKNCIHAVLLQQNE
jgi:hypothetical protein